MQSHQNLEKLLYRLQLCNAPAGHSNFSKANTMITKHTALLAIFLLPCLKACHFLMQKENKKGRTVLPPSWLLNTGQYCEGHKDGAIPFAFFTFTCTEAFSTEYSHSEIM